MRSGCRWLTASAFSAARRAARVGGSRPSLWAAPSIARSSTFGLCVSTESPALTSSASRVALVEASSSLSDAVQSAGMTLFRDEFHAMVAVVIDDRCRRLLDGAARHIDHRPAMAGEEPARGCYFLRHRL